MLDLCFELSHEDPVFAFVLTSDGKVHGVCLWCVYRGSACDLVIVQKPCYATATRLADIEKRKGSIRERPSRHLGVRSRRVEMDTGILCLAFGSIPYVCVAVTDVLFGWPRECWGAPFKTEYLPDRC